MKGFNSKRFLTSITILLVLFVAYIYYSSHINVISADLLNSKELTFDYKGNKISVSDRTSQVKNFDSDAPILLKNECTDSELSNFLKWRNIVAGDAKSLFIKEKQNKNQNNVFETSSNSELSHSYKLELASPKSNIIDLLIYTDNQNRIKLIELNRYISQHESSGEAIYFHPETGIISYTLSEFEYKSGFSHNYTETENHTAIICNDKVIDNFNLRSVNNTKIINSAYGIKELSNRIVSDILKKSINNTIPSSNS
ncbi:hypothetical protein ERX46_10480 [Brumimicrobium glaciale]|uniref:Uncharacterized protein n=1 Tax=Brumimicrobium glaciale TaxID=200475 RepID=A0A4Q4KN64_9FLAO|nr:hypothetical protein [Brumimicrobium glaciale]RYM33359.1 hypothetical protein ERX46_10480 [Brumimicrobium glaciale]